jgi:hypothetical protein
MSNSCYIYLLHTIKDYSEWMSREQINKITNKQKIPWCVVEIVNQNLEFMGPRGLRINV